MYHSIEKTIGHTPLVELPRLSKAAGAYASIFAKLEGRNPAGSAKDRAALFMIRAAEQRGDLQPGGTILEPTSGNTGIAIAALATALGYQAILTMPDTMSQERQQLLEAYGAQLVLTPGQQGMAGAIEKARALAREIPGAVIWTNSTTPPTPRPTMRPPARAVGGQRRDSGRFDRRCWHRRYALRFSPVSQTAKLPGVYSGSGAAEFSCAVRRPARPPRAPGHRRRVCAGQLPPGGGG